MSIDRYTKTILTIIALSLAVLASERVGLVRGAAAYGSGEDVRVTNFETDVSYGETLYVYCTNC